jgi:hypothetical protein
MTILIECKAIWPLASRWLAELERFSRDPKAASISLESSMADSVSNRLLPFISFLLFLLTPLRRILFRTFSILELRHSLSRLGQALQMLRFTVLPIFHAVLPPPLLHPYRSQPPRLMNTSAEFPIAAPRRLSCHLSNL